MSPTYQIDLAKKLVHVKKFLFERREFKRRKKVIFYPMGIFTCFSNCLCVYTEKHVKRPVKTKIALNEKSYKAKVT
jgi:hypothetical protein